MLKHILVFTANLDFNVRWNIVTLADEFPDTKFTIFLHNPPKTIKTLLKNQFRNLKLNGWRWILNQGEIILEQIFNKFSSSHSGSSSRTGSAFTLTALKQREQISIEAFYDINGTESLNFLTSLSVDLGVVLSAPMLKKEIFDFPKLGSINLHKGHLPNYRGSPPAFWELKNKEKKVGCTVYKIDSDLNSGDILMEKFTDIDKYSTVKGVQVKLDHLGINMLVEAVKLISEQKIVFMQQTSVGHTYTTPTLDIKHRLDSELKNHSFSESKKRYFIKKIVFFFYSSVFASFINRLHGLLGQQKVIILLYHRVSDQFKDNVTIGIEQFDEQMAYLERNCETVSLSEIVDGRVRRNSSKPVIAISFDDGYLDNFENAAPILLKYQLPCTFFISTEKIAANKPFAHDMVSLGFGLDNMNWDQVHKMKDWGFDFGSHTINHVNLTEVSDSEAMYELEGSLNEIRKQLNQNDVFIAYPYGGRQHMNSTRLQMIKNVGYSACFSAYGGHNKTKMDVFNIERIGINWAFNMMAFKARLLGWDKAK